MYKAIIIEDEKNAASMLEQMLSDIEPGIEIQEKCIDLPSGVKSIKRYNPKIVFLDIELPVYSGLQLLDFFNPEEVNFHIIFTTAFNEYAVRAFEMCAVDYLMKPIQEDKLRLALEKIIGKQFAQGMGNLPILKQNFQNINHKKIVLPISNGFEILNLHDIYYLKAEGSYTRIYINTGKSLLVSKNLKHFQFVLSDTESFLRIHRSIIVNVNFAKKLIRNDGGTLILEDKTELPVSDDKINELLNLLQKI